MSKKRMNRRQFMEMTSKLALSYPFWPYLLESAQGAGPVVPNVIFVRSWYGFTPTNWYRPFDNRGDTNTLLAPDVYGKALSGIPDALNPILGNAFDAYRADMSILMGLDILTNLHDHNSTAMLTGSTPLTGQSEPQFPNSVDVILESSTAFYPQLPRVGVLRLGPESFEANHTFSYKNSAPVAANWDAKSLVETYFKNIGTGTAPGKTLEDKKKLVIDAILPEYQRLMASTALSTGDKARVDQFADHLQTLDSRLQQSTPPPASCQKPVLKPTSDLMANIYSNHIDAAIAALICKFTRVVTLEIRHFEDNLKYDGSAFHTGTHEENPAQDAKCLRENLWIRDRVLELVRKLNSTVDADGSKLADNTIVFWGNELSSRQSNHRLENMPIVMFIGKNITNLRRGYLLDYRQRPFIYRANRSDFPSMGQPYGKFLIALMTSLGLKPQDWEVGGQPGIGSFQTGPYYTGFYDRFLTTDQKRKPLDYFYIG